MTEIDSLREMLDSQRSHESGERARVIRAAMRADPAATHALMDRLYVQGLQEAYAGSDHSGLAALAAVGATELDTIGEHRGAIARLDQALTMVPADSNERARILCHRAVYEGLALNIESARDSLELARHAIPDNAPLESSIELRSCRAILASIEFRIDELQEITAVITEAQANEFDWVASSLMVYLIGALAAVGESGQARAWADGLRGYAGAMGHAARDADARAAQAALRVRLSTDVELDVIDEQALRTFNNPALWHIRVLSIHRSLIQGDRVGAAVALEQLERIRPIMHDAYKSGSEGFALAVHALLEPGAVVDIAPPDVVTSLSVGAALAGAEATAIAGPLTRAADWLKWFDYALPQSVATSLEWPVCRKRVEGLLLLRTGDHREAVVRLQEAIACCDNRGDIVQAAIGRLQLAEALLRGSGVVHPSFREELIAEADPEGLRLLGVDPIPFAYATSRTFLREETAPERGGLTAREAQVLGRLARGDSYNDIAKELNINPRTVGVHASHCYEKLGVRNRVEAVQTAVRLGIVS